MHEDARVAHPSRGTTALVIGIITVVLLFFYFVRNALIPFVFAGVIAFVATPAIDCSMGSNLQASIASLVSELIGNHTINMFGNSLNADSIAEDLVDGVAGLLSTHVFTLMSYSFASMIGMILSFVLLGYMLFGGSSTGAGDEPGGAGGPVFCGAPIN